MLPVPPTAVVGAHMVIRNLRWKSLLQKKRNTLLTPVHVCFVLCPSGVFPFQRTTRKAGGFACDLQGNPLQWGNLHMEVGACCWLLRMRYGRYGLGGVVVSSPCESGVDSEWAYIFRCWVPGPASTAFWVVGDFVRLHLTGCARASATVFDTFPRGLCHLEKGAFLTFANQLKRSDVYHCHACRRRQLQSQTFFGSYPPRNVSMFSLFHPLPRSLPLL